MRLRRGMTGAVILAALAAWTYAGYAIGEARGRGWRGAMIDGTCRVVCKL